MKQLDPRAGFFDATWQARGTEREGNINEKLELDLCNEDELSHLNMENSYLEDKSTLWLCPNDSSKVLL